MAAASSSSSSSSGLCWKYDVFLNFRRKDTRRGFVSHLYKALCKKSIKTFIGDEKLRKDDHLSKLKTTIQESRISIVVFSRNYAFSTWCLRELVEILECKDTKGHIVLPIFYDVEPSHIRRLRRSFRTALTKHKRDSNIDVEEVQSWESALAEASMIYGWESQNNDAELVEEIVEDVLNKLNNSSTSSRDNGLVEMDPPEVEMNDVCVVGIWGVGDLGKITTAGAVYFASSFEACRFLEKLEIDFMKHGKGHMRRQFQLSISNNRVGRSDISNKGLQGLVEQVEALLGEQHSLGDGSRIFITFSRGSGCTELISTWIRSSIMEQSIRPSICVCKYVASERNHEDIAMSTPFANLRTPPVLIQFG